MTFQAFEDSLQDAAPPPGIRDSLRALWYAGKEDWTTAHDIAQEVDTAEGSWIHAYLHRWEGDDWNANYWYRRAGKSMPTYDLEEEWRVIVRELVPRLRSG